jgi:hypothetical protein
MAIDLLGVGRFSSAGHIHSADGLVCAPLTGKSKKEKSEMEKKTLIWYTLPIIRID